MATYTTDELNEILTEHSLWLNGEPLGVRADLYKANLREAYLCGANLRGANLREANLRGADLRGANLREASLCGADLCDANLSEANLREAYLYRTNLYRANLSGAYLSGAYLRGANLYRANLYRANLRGADLCGANLREANLREANLSGAYLYRANLSGAIIDFPIACPEEGKFTGFKKAHGGYIVELEIPEYALRSSATTKKCRCSKAKVISITKADGSQADRDIVFSEYDNAFSYEVGKEVSVNNFDTNRWNECAPGIHFFMSRQDAVGYVNY